MKDQKRVIIENILPQINCGKHYIKRVVGQKVSVRADVMGDGHDIIAASVLYKHRNDKKWREIRMEHVNNDEWEASFSVEKQGFYAYKVQAWVDHALNWQHGITRKIEDRQQVRSELLEGAELLKVIRTKLDPSEKKFIDHLKEIFVSREEYKEAVVKAVGQELRDIFLKYPAKKSANSSKTMDVYVDRKKALFSTWYEFFPRSASKKQGVHGTFKDCERLLPRIAEMGFDTLYFPPIHPIGEVNRKGKNNTETASDGDVGSCWGIGSKEGGHKDIHPQLGTREDFVNLVKKAREHNLEIALDYALQAAPDHPWVKSNPDWFKWRPDGTVQYAENPPKKYQDILPIYFESKDFKNLWEACLDILYYWIECGVRIFRVDNPHTKPYYFWNWIIGEVKKRYPDVLFLAEAFTRPKVMQQLAKQGFTQSYTYFTWRNTKYEFTEYIEELTKTDQREYMRPNFWPNTPDINPFHLQGAKESEYIKRYVLAATLSSNTGIYGPVFEYMISDALPGREEYLHSEKYQLYTYDWEKENNLTGIITSVNRVRKEQEALQQTNNIKFCKIENDNLIAFYKWNDDKSNELLIIINLDPNYTQEGFVQLPLQDLGIYHPRKVQVHDLVTQNTYDWFEEYNYVKLHPSFPFHIFKITK